MLPKDRRINKGSFDEILKKAPFFHTDTFFSRVLMRKDKQPSLFAVVVTVKVEKTSVGRHLIKRRILGVLEKLLINTKPGLSCIIYCKKNLLTFSFKEVEKETINLLIKSKVLNDKGV